MVTLYRVVLFFPSYHGHRRVRSELATTVDKRSRTQCLRLVPTNADFSSPVTPAPMLSSQLPPPHLAAPFREGNLFTGSVGFVLLIADNFNQRP